MKESEAGFGEINKAESFVNRYRQVFRSLAGDDRIKFEAGREESYFDSEEMKVVVGYQESLSEQENVFLMGHELGHVSDMAANTEAYAGSFDYCKNRSQELVPQVKKILEDKGIYDSWYDGNLESLIYEKLRFFYNVVQDVSVNRRMGQRLAWMRDKEMMESIYQNFLFEEKDLSKSLLSDQFGYFILLGQMAPNGGYLFDEEVSRAGEEYTSDVNEVLEISLNQEVAEKTSPAVYQRHGYTELINWTKESIEPVFVRFLMKDFEDNPPTEEDQKEIDKKMSSDSSGKREQGKQKEQEEQKEGKGKSSSKWSDEIKTDSLDKKEVDQYRERKKAEEKKREEKKLSPEEKAKRAEAEVDEAVARKHGLKKELAREYRLVEARVSEYKERMADVFESFMKTIQEKIRTFAVKNYMSGKFDVDSFIDKYGGGLSNPDLADEIPWNNLDTYIQNEVISRLALYPAEVYFHLVLDGSGSMNEQRREELKKVSVLFLESLGTFESRVNLKFRLKKPFAVKTEIRMFGSKEEVVKSIDKLNTPEEELASRFKVLEKIGIDYGNTYDAIPLGEINKGIDQENEKKIKTKKRLEVVILVTDGGSDTEIQSKNEVNSLKKKGVIVKGLQIGDPSEQGREIFSSIWGEDGAEVKDLKELVPTMIKLTSKVINLTEPSINFYEVEEDE
jgi:hypothetical protein